MTEAGKRIRIAVAGLGVIARTVHLPLLQRRADLFDVVALSDLSPSRLAELGDRYGVEPARRYPDAEAMLAGGGCDAVLLATSGSHGELAGAALRRGLPVLCEKPLAYTLAEADRLADAGAALMVGYMKQYDPAVAEAARLLDEIGGPAAVHAVEVTVLHAAGEQQLTFANLPPAPRDVPAAELARLRNADERLLDAAVGGDAGARALYQILINSVSHDLSLLRLFTGAPATVDHVATWPLAPDGPAEPSVELSGRLPAGGRYGIRWLNLPDCPAYRETVTLHHARGALELVFPSPYLLNAPTTLTAVDRHGGGERRAVFRSVTEAFEQELVAFHAMVTAGARPLTGIVEGAADVRTGQQVVRRYGELTGAAIGGEAAS
ncbi:Gfo/Idh/MocA family oxidoreductase [Micromonospora sp. 4G57]|uniref:Gfo/Idh/MocA family oxidoreductase n=1 Tax=Micromonospora sicca TaxID=2202420 RepID=A0ABU5J6F7_9ACTN|nr:MULTISPECIES: Gfo/Idh/MocA family oxidoreductase [unclassified Micromonospora]MDZ5443128.1 Gfo/Idh/MocA family oxidoreductase [Micromonospora sp. 4G57]MDZ5488160.1 Gfo/Idh/MocA family oxidoreductase [Micromonospora sp. 4G53]